eukprot:8131578-Alexandrium_andersonii.AAC.1
MAACSLHMHSADMTERNSRSGIGGLGPLPAIPIRLERVRGGRAAGHPRQVLFAGWAAAPPVDI